MKKKKTNYKMTQYPNFILCDMGLQSAFNQMCQNFQTKLTSQTEKQNWLIIDNDTGEIIIPTDNVKTQT